MRVEFVFVIILGPMFSVWRLAVCVCVISFFFFLDGENKTRNLARTKTKSAVTESLGNYIKTISKMLHTVSWSVKATWHVRAHFLLYFHFSCATHTHTKRANRIIFLGAKGDLFHCFNWLKRCEMSSDIIVANCTETKIIKPKKSRVTERWMRWTGDIFYMK